MNTPRTQTIPQREGDIISGCYLTDLLEVGIEEALFVVLGAPASHNCASTADDAGESLECQGNVLLAQAGVDGEVIYSLLRLLDERIPIDFPAEVVGIPSHLLQSLIEGHCTYRYGAIADNPLARLVDVSPGGEIHHRIGSPASSPDGLLHLFSNAAGDG